MSHRLERTLQALILVGLGLFLLHKLWSGTLYWYINDRFFALVLGAALGFLLLARAVLPAWQPAPAAGGSAPPCDAHHEHDDGHGHRQGGAAWRLWIVALPLLLGLLVPARPLGSSALAKKGLNSSAPIAAADGDEQVRLDPEMRNVLDWLRAFNSAADPAAFTGQRANVTGFVYHDRTLGPGEFVVSRFAVTCCAADATGLGLRVQWQNAAALEGDAWVRVRGRVEAGTYAGQPIPVIVAESVEGVEPPQQPYLYP